MLELILANSLFPIANFYTSSILTACVYRLYSIEVTVAGPEFSDWGVVCRARPMLDMPLGERDIKVYCTMMRDCLICVFSGVMRYLSTRNTLSLLQCLYNSYHAASMLDARPGLKFLFQKVARAEVAANLYKQAGVSLTFYMHALLEICCHQDNSCVDSTKRVLAEISQSPDGPNKGTGLITTEQMDSFDNELGSAIRSCEPVQRHIGVFVRKLKAAFDEVCTDYVDLYLEKEGPNVADRLSTQLLVFLTAQPEEIATLKRDKSIREMVAEKLLNQQQQQPQPETVTAADGAMSLQAVPIQGWYW